MFPAKADNTVPAISNTAPIFVVSSPDILSLTFLKISDPIALSKT